MSVAVAWRSPAVWLLWLGYLLNVLRGVIPAYLGLQFGVVTADQIAPFTLPWLATTVDVHHMAGLSLIAIAFSRTPASVSETLLNSISSVSALKCCNKCTAKTRAGGEPLVP